MILEAPKTAPDTPEVAPEQKTLASLKKLEPVAGYTREFEFTVNQANDKGQSLDKKVYNFKEYPITLEESDKYESKGFLGVQKTDKGYVLNIRKYYKWTDVTKTENSTTYLYSFTVKDDGTMEHDLLVTANKEKTSLLTKDQIPMSPAELLGKFTNRVESANTWVTAFKKEQEQKKLDENTKKANEIKKQKEDIEDLSLNINSNEWNTTA